jgi:ABC-type lipoprotein release transport system permease subunit
MTHLLSDLRFALRTFRRNPGFTAIAVLSIALGIGANTAIFTLVDQVLLRLLPVKNPQQLVQVTQEGDLYGSDWGDGSELSYPTYTEIRDRNKVFSGVLAMALAIVGLYGVMAYTVARRTREIGIRMALGARGVDVGWLVMRETLTIAVIGAVAGLPIAWWLSRFIESQLYGVTPMDGTSVGGSVLALAAAALVSGLAPTRRAVSVEPMRALRID